MTDTTDTAALSWARLHEMKNTLSEFEDIYDRNEDKENFEVMRDAQALIDELISLRGQLGTASIRLEAERQRADAAVSERNTALKQASAARSGFDEQYQLREKAEGSVVVLAGIVARKESEALKGNQVPVAWKVTTPSGSIVFHTEEQDMDGHSYYGNTVTPLFTAPQKPVVLDLNYFDEHFDRLLDEKDDDIEIGQLGARNYEALHIAIHQSIKAAIEAAGGIVKDGE
ncbi:hypothetical protein AB6896_08995 [Rahnella inusitata]|uniref:hypothetical protein n=1 Tax=Rahnella inusitata TaxID=58169 RepID=UPI0039BE9EBF